MVEEVINLVVGNYRIKLYKHKVIKTGTYRIDKPYELIILINMAMSGDTPDFRETYHDYFKTKKQAEAVIATLPINCGFKKKR